MRQIDNMTPDEIETLHLKGMLSMGIEHKQLDKKRVEIQMHRIASCDILLNYVHDDIPHAEQQPITDQLNVLRGRLVDEMNDALTP